MSKKQKPNGIAADLEAWKASYTGVMSPATQAQVIRLVRELVSLAGARTLREVSADDLSKYMSAMHCGEGRRKCSAKSIVTYQSYLHAFFEWAVQTKRIRANPATNLPKLRFIQKKQRAFSAEEVGKLISAAPLEHACMIRFMAVTGIRPKHVEAIRVRAFQLDATPARCVFLDTKTHAEREVAIDPETAAMLRRRFEGLDPDAQPFRRLHHDHFDLLLDVAGIPKHDARGRSAGYSGLRRFGPTLGGKLGLDPESLRLQLGHSNLSTTMKHYNDADLSSQAAAASALGAAISGSPQQPPETLAISPGSESRTREAPRRAEEGPDADPEAVTISALARARGAISAALRDIDAVGGGGTLGDVRETLEGMRNQLTKRIGELVSLPG